MTVQEKKNDRLGMGISLGVHAALLVLFIFLLAWKEPFPPLPEYGIEVNFGLETAGSGDVQPTTVFWCVMDFRDVRAGGAPHRVQRLHTVKCLNGC